MMQEFLMRIGTTIAGEFSDLNDVEQLTRVILRLCMAALLGAIIGFEREKRGRAAGLRTHILVTLGAAIFVIVPLEAGMSVGDLSRVLQGVVTGVGFLGAGTIMKMDDQREIQGLTTAASIWVAAAIGISAGAGREATAVLSTLAALFVLAVLRRVGHKHIDDADRQPAPVAREHDKVN